MYNDKVERLKAIDKKYKPMINLYNKKVEVISSIEIDNKEEFELSACKIYLLLNHISKTKDKLNELGYRKQAIYRRDPRKINLDDVMKVLRNIDKDEMDKYKSLAWIQYKENGGLI